MMVMMPVASMIVSMRGVIAMLAVRVFMAVIVAVVCMVLIILFKKIRVYI